MKTLRARFVKAALLCWPMLLAAGCDNAANLKGTTPGTSTPAVTDAVVFGALAKVVSADTANTTQSDTDVAPNFGEDAARYAAQADATTMAFDDTTSLTTLVSEETEPAATGTLGGRFINDRPDSNSDESNGSFRGQWFGADGNAVGAIRGEYFALRSIDLPDPLTGGGLFRGKLIDNDGRFLGFIHGRYGHAPDEQSLFFGRWFDRDMRVVGVMRGRWMDDPTMNGGQFGGEWAAFDVCAVGDALPDIDFEDGDFGSYDTTPEMIDAAVFVAGAGPARRDIADAETAPTPPCIDPNQPYGFLRGWHIASVPTDENPLPLDGGFRGHWVTADGMFHGALLGRWEIRDHASASDSNADIPPTLRPFRQTGVFYGKIVNADGEVIGFLRGVFGARWYGLGVFRGEYFNTDGEFRGVLRGRWDIGPQRPGGPFVGTWNGVELAEPVPATP